MGPKDRKFTCGVEHGYNRKIFYYGEASERSNGAEKEVERASTRRSNKAGSNFNVNITDVATGSIDSRENSADDPIFLDND